MTLKTCLLVSDDPDDQLHFSEALNEVSPDCVLLTVMNSKQALDAIKGHKLKPDYIFLDLTMQDNYFDEFRKIARNHDGIDRPSKLVAYGEDDLALTAVTPSKLEKDFTYTQLKEFLKRSLV